MKDHRPTEEFYSLFQFLYDFINQDLFKNSLPDCMITITRKTQTFGYFSPKRWVNEEQTKSDEIAINPTYFDQYPLIEILQTLTHEMCHLWQYHFGTPSKRTYHNKEWGEKMISLGLMPSNTGKPEGKTTGQQMMEYPIPNKPFEKMANKLVKHQKFKHLWFDRFKKEKSINETFETVTTTIKVDGQDMAIIENEVYQALNIDPTLLEIRTNPDPVILNTTKNKGKGKYKCPSCGNQIWGKQHLNVLCGDCNVPFDQIN